MPVYSEQALPLIQRYKAAHDAEGAAIQALLSYMQSGGVDQERLSKLTDAMTAALDKTTEIYADMQVFRIDG